MQVKLTIPRVSDPDQARQLLPIYAPLVRSGTLFRNVAGVAVSYNTGETEALVVVSILSTTNWKMIRQTQAGYPVTLPRDPELQAFREGPMIVDTLEKLSLEPDLVMVFGHGIAHPQRFGVACYVGISMELPTLGVSTLWPFGLRGPAGVVGNSRGSSVALRGTDGRECGWMLRTQPNEEPLYASPGHRVTVDECAQYTLRAAPWHQLPEPLRLAAQVGK